ncbi:MAG: hypothetical protein JNM93_12525 [Bacteriovoracaceae bacterium]|nr:hypothetical protein [Bacteriovoracaceae bacterium]
MIKFILIFLFSMPLWAQVKDSVTCVEPALKQVHLSDCSLDITIAGQLYKHGTAGWERAIDITYAEESQGLADMNETLRVPNDSCSLSFKIGDVTHYMCDEGLFVIRDLKLKTISGKEWNEILADVVKYREEMCSRY